ncbi:MAG: hypothetical protein OEM77_07600 [Nitrosopumilus sp.]|nr:hypothetical protein [Nitrosopumilus sp.]MDH3737451.1 hypothetical protein [Nitrosopumilus sp.]MDH3822830.1 hypothetical protein [Nitrosopumilus sp.]MDH3834361.1 hypothetical protein [Nitrosopumilus sp.]
MKIEYEKLKFKHKIRCMMRNKETEKSLVKDYKKLKPKDNVRYRESIKDVMENTKPWKSVRKFYNFEVNPILNEKVIITDTRSEKNEIPDILFEYLVIRSVTILEVHLKHYCKEFVQKFPDRAESLLKNRDKEKDLVIQILSSYSFSNLEDLKHLFSTLLGKDYFQVLRHRSEEHKSSIGYESEHIRYASPIFKKWAMFEQLITLRNKLVHENKHINIKNKRVRKNLLNTIYEVIYYTDNESYKAPYTESEFDEIRPRY